MTKAKDSHGTIRCNIPICGGPTSGKTSLICQYASLGRDFPKTYKMTVGTELSIVDVNVPREEMDVKLQLLDTAVRHWHTILSARTSKPEAPLKGVLVACKIDLPPSLHQIRQDEGETLANELGLEFVLASGTRLADARRPFEQISRLIIDEYKYEVSRIAQCVSNM